MCKKCKKKEKSVKCNLCNKSLYCSEQCADTDWESHRVECNVHDISAVGKKATVFLPYVGEDMLSREDLEKLDKDSFLLQDHLLHYRDASGKVSQRVVTPPLVAGLARFEQGRVTGQQKMARGAKPDAMDLAKPHGYVIRVYQGLPFDDRADSRFMDIRGDLETDAIYRGNKKNETARKLASIFLRRSDKTNFVLWPSPREVENASLASDVTFPTVGGNIAVEVWVGEKKPAASLRGVYQFHRFTQTGAGRMKRKIFGALDMQMRLKRKGMDDTLSPENLEVLRATDDEGNRVQLTFLLPQKRGRSYAGLAGLDAQLIDVEFSLPVRKWRQAALNAKIEKDGPIVIPDEEPAQAEIKFRCDPRNLEAVTGLVMALEKHAQAQKEAGEDISHLRSQMVVIADHQRKLEDARRQGTEASLKIPPTVNAAVHSATEYLWQEVGSEMRVKKYVDKITRFGASYATQRAKELTEKMQQLRDTKGGVKGVVARVQKSRTRRDINDLQAAIARARVSPNLSKEAGEELDRAMFALREEYTTM